MTTRTMMLALLLATAGLVGCIGDSGDGSDASSAGDEPVEPATDGEDAANETVPGPRIENSSRQGTVMGARVGSVTTFCAGSCENVLEFEVEENVSAIVAEMAWNASDALILDVAHPIGDQCEPVTPGGLLVDCSAGQVSGASPLRLEITDETVLAQPGTWDARAFAERSAQPVEFTISVSVVYDDVPLDRISHTSP